MNRLFYFIAGCFAVSQATAQPPAPLTEGARLLFTNVTTRLTDSEKNQVFKLTGFRLSPDRKSFADASDTKGEFPFQAFLYPVDLNKDGTEELFVLFGNSYTSGLAGSSIILFVKNKTGTYHAELGFPGMLPDVLPAAELAFPDLLIGGPGMEYPVWKWNGTNYVFSRNVKDSEYEKTRKTNAAVLSKEYTGRL